MGFELLSSSWGKGEDKAGVEVQSGIEVLAFRDINPPAPRHIIIIPKMKDGLTRLSKAEKKHIGILGQLLYTAKLVAS
ncbi:14 kDa zinc-binding [Olea europaea subsp. europaea]|uniref:14 kDa zinc-binding n=1 Tax=Olea europaea subsp. europaea TaxID=158383 RepID=A0A8S0PI50_OLEEU|nr:14 kDa zinc-binding [Olea europaea subsp. europaea]